jgi:hypothetical protein
MVGIELPGEDRLPAGPARDLVVALHELYRGAGRPGLRKIAQAVVHGHNFMDTVSHETVSDMLSGKSIPRWSKLDCVVRQLAEWNTPRLGPSETAERFLILWDAAVGGSLGLALEPASASRTNTSPVARRTGTPTQGASPSRSRETPAGSDGTTAVAHRMRPTDRSLIYAQGLKLALLKIGYIISERSEDTGPMFVVEDGQQNVIFLDAHYVNSMNPISTSIIEGAIETAARTAPPVLLVANELPAKRAQLNIARSKNIDFMVWQNEGDNEELAARILPLMEHSQA